MDPLFIVSNILKKVIVVVILVNLRGIFFVSFLSFFTTFLVLSLFFFWEYLVLVSDRSAVLFLAIALPSKDRESCKHCHFKCPIGLMDMHSPVNAADDNIISKLESTFGGSLHIQDAQKSEHVSEENDIGNCHVGEGQLCVGFEQQETKPEIKCLKNCSTFPYRDKVLPSSSSDEEADTSLTESLSKQSPHQSYSCSVSLPAPSKLVSAMKGSREKQWGSQMKLTVKWAPDVYDPVPTLLSRTVKSKKQQKSRIKKSEKKNGKKGQKGNYSKGGSGKEKKQYHYRWPEYRDKLIEASTESNDLDVSHDSYHGISSLKKPVTENHCHVGEALSNIFEFVSYIKTA